MPHRLTRGIKLYLDWYGSERLWWSRVFTTFGTFKNYIKVKCENFQFKILILFIWNSKLQEKTLLFLQYSITIFCSHLQFKMQLRVSCDNVKCKYFSRLTKYVFFYLKFAINWLLTKQSLRVLKDLSFCHKLWFSNRTLRYFKLRILLNQMLHH